MGLGFGSGVVVDVGLIGCLVFVGDITLGSGCLVVCFWKLVVIVDWIRLGFWFTVGLYLVGLVGVGLIGVVCFWGLVVIVGWIRLGFRFMVGL